MGPPEGPNESLPAWHRNRSYLHRRSVPLPSRSATGSAHRTTHPATPRPRPGRLHVLILNQPSNSNSWDMSRTGRHGQARKKIPIPPEARLRVATRARCRKGAIDDRAVWSNARDGPIAPLVTGIVGQIKCRIALKTVDAVTSGMALTGSTACTAEPLKSVAQSHLARHVHKLGGAEYPGGARIRRVPNRYSRELIVPLDSSERFGPRRRRPTRPAERPGGRA